MSGGYSKSYSSTLDVSRGIVSSSEKERYDAYEKRAERVLNFRSTIDTKSLEDREVRDVRDFYVDELVKNNITKPKDGVENIHVVLVDNSGSNREIAQHLKKSSGYLTSVLRSIDPISQIAFFYFSDHRDGDRMFQYVDFVSPDEIGDKTLFSSISHIQDANGHDIPEAIECALWKACEFDFGSAKKRHLYLITDVVAHGMGYHDDDGCPYQRDWLSSVNRVMEIYTTFEVIGCGNDIKMSELQKKFILNSERLQYDFIDLSSINEIQYRIGITGNALLFLIARHTGVQGVELFLSFLYEKWLSDPIFGSETDTKAREGISRFGKYIEEDETKVKEMMQRILVD